MALNIMIVDDSPVMRVFIRKVVGLTGLDVGECCESGDGEEALQQLRSRWLDLVLTDINMPRMNGEELIRQMRSDDLLRSIPVIVVSTDASHGRVQRMLSLGAKGYIATPFTPDALRLEMEKLFGGGHE